MYSIFGVKLYVMGRELDGLIFSLFNCSMMDPLVFHRNYIIEEDCLRRQIFAFADSST